jgi:hypothetical protein
LKKPDHFVPGNPAKMVASQDVVIFSLEPLSQNLLRAIGRKDARTSEKPILKRCLVLPFSINNLWRVLSLHLVFL